MSPMETKVDPPRFTYGEYVQWQGDERWELIDGEAWLMSPAPSVAHQDIVLSLSVQLFTLTKDGPCKALVSPIDVLLPDSDEADDAIETVVQPDVVVVCDPSKIKRKAIRGAPDFVVEVLSPRSSVRDRVQKAELYARHGVKEYWVIDPDNRTVEIRQLAEPGRGRAPVVCDATEPLKVGVLENARVELTDVFAYIDALEKSEDA